MKTKYTSEVGNSRMTDKIIGRREFMHLLIGGLATYSLAQNEDYRDAFAFPCPINEGLFLGLNDKAKDGKVTHGIWKYSVNNQNLEKIVDLPEIFQGLGDEEWQNADPRFIATNDGKYIALRTTQLKDWTLNQRVFFLDTETKKCEELFDQHTSTYDEFYFLPNTHKFNAIFRHSDPDERVVFLEIDFDAKKSTEFFSLPATGIRESIRTIASVIEDNSRFEVFWLRGAYSTLAYQDFTKHGKLRFIRPCKLGGKTDWYKPHLTRDGKYFAIDNGLFELVGDRFENRIMQLENAKILINFSDETECLGWNLSQELVAFKENAEKPGKPHSLTVCNRKGNVVYKEPIKRKINYSFWYDNDNILISPLKKRSSSGMKMINIKNGQRQPILEDINFPLHPPADIW